MCTRQVYDYGAKDTSPLTHLNLCTSGHEGEGMQFVQHDSVQWGCSAQLVFFFFFLFLLEAEVGPYHPHRK